MLQSHTGSTVIVTNQPVPQTSLSTVQPCAETQWVLVLQFPSRDRDLSWVLRHFHETLEHLSSILLILRVRLVLLQLLPQVQ